MRGFQYFVLPVVLVLAILCGCSNEIQLKEVGRNSREDSFVKAAKNFDGLSDVTLNYLNANQLYGTFKSDPDYIIKMLNRRFMEHREREILEMLANICHYMGRKHSDIDKSVRYYTSCAVYSYYYLFSNEVYPPKSAFANPDDLFVSRYYNASVTNIFEFLNKKGMIWQESYMLPTVIDDMPLHFSKPVCKLSFPQDYYDNFFPTSNYEVKHALTISGVFGIGAPLIAILKTDKDLKSEYLTGGMPSPVTAFLRLKYQDNRIQANLELYDAFRAEFVEIAGNNIPLELDFTTPLAYMLKRPALLPAVFALLNPDKTGKYNNIYMLTPYSKDRIPVLFVHGLLSNPRTWAQLLNTLMNSDAIRQNYQFMMFGYSTGNPVIYSARELRRQLTEFHHKFDPDSTNPKFNQMIVIGHSMGGLLTKTLIQDSDNRLPKLILGDKAEKIQNELTEEQRKYFDDLVNYKSLPFVKRVVFMAVPHRGSSMATLSFAGFFSSLITLPQDLLTTVYSLSKGALADAGFLSGPDDVYIATGISTLDPKNRSLVGLSELPFVEGVKYHSIIGNAKAAGIPGGNDGIVEYQSSHLDGAESELVVKSGHSVQQNAAAIDEVRRILLQHLHENGLLKGYGYKKEDLQEKSEKPH